MKRKLVGVYKIWEDDMSDAINSELVRTTPLTLTQCVPLVYDSEIADRILSQYSPEQIMNTLICDGAEDDRKNGPLDQISLDYQDNGYFFEELKKKEPVDVGEGSTEWLFAKYREGWLQAESVLIQEGEEVGVVREKDESLTSYAQRISRYEAIDPERLQKIYADADILMKEVIESQKELNGTMSREQIEERRIDDYGVHSGTVYRSSSSLTEGEYQVAPLLRKFGDYKRNLPELRVIADILRHRIDASDEIDIGRWLYTLKQTGGHKGNPFFSSSQVRNGAEIHQIGDDKIMKIDLPGSGFLRWGLKVDEGRRNEQWGNEDEVAMYLYIDPEWIEGQSINNRAVRVEKTEPVLILQRKKIPSYFSDEKYEKNEVQRRVDEAEEKYNAKLKKYEEKYGEEYYGPEFDYEGMEWKYKNEVREIIRRGNRGLAVRVRTIEMREHAGIQISEEFNSELMEGMMNNPKYGPLTRRLIAYYEYDNMHSSALIDCLRIIRGAVELEEEGK